MTGNPDVQEWLQWVQVTSVPLRRLDVGDIPVGIASACLIDYQGRRFLLSVQHAVDMGAKDWIIDLGYDPSKGTEFYRPRSFNYVMEMTRGTGVIREIDFCYTEVPNDLISIYQHVTPRGISDERPRHVFETELTATPDPEQIFAFAGEVKPEYHGPSTVVTEMHVFPGLRYLRTEGEFHVFQLPVPHPGHQQFRGCSGAPIVDMNKSVVALVCDGDIPTNTIRGVSLARYKFAVDFICGHESRA